MLTLHSTLKDISETYGCLGFNLQNSIDNSVVPAFSVNASSNFIEHLGGVG